MTLRHTESVERVMVIATIVQIKKIRQLQGTGLAELLSFSAETLQGGGNGKLSS